MSRNLLKQGGYTEIAKVTLQVWFDQFGRVNYSTFWLTGVNGETFQRTLQKNETNDYLAAMLLKRGFTDDHCHSIGRSGAESLRRSKKLHVIGPGPENKPIQDSEWAIYLRLLKER